MDSDNVLPSPRTYVLQRGDDDNHFRKVEGIQGGATDGRDDRTTGIRTVGHTAAWDHEHDGPGPR